MLKPGTMIIETKAVGPLQCNCSLVICEKTKKALVVDPGGDWPLIQGWLQSHDAVPEMILHTHAHLDHVGATQDVRASQEGCQCSFHKGDQWLVDHMGIQAALLQLPYTPLDGVDHWCADGEHMTVGEEIKVEIMHTPGHTPGSISFLVSEGEANKAIFSGDTLFREGIGRFDLWGGSEKDLMDSIKGRLMSWPEALPVVTGHGPETTLQYEREHNPFL